MDLFSNTSFSATSYDVSDLKWSKRSSWDEHWWHIFVFFQVGPIVWIWNFWKTYLAQCLKVLKFQTWTNFNHLIRNSLLFFLKNHFTDLKLFSSHNSLQTRLKIFKILKYLMIEFIIPIANLSTRYLDLFIKKLICCLF